MDASESIAEEQFRVLLRVALELACRTNHTRKYLHQAVPRGSSEQVRILEIREVLDGALLALQDQLEKTLTTVSLKRTSHPKESVLALHDDLRSFSHWFVKVHEFLMLLPYQPARPETATVLSASFGDYHSELQPSIILGSVFNAFEFDFYDLMRNEIPDLHELMLEDGERVVLQLALCDRASPSAWPILAHEMGHAIDNRFRISEKIAETLGAKQNTLFAELAKNWCGELCADLIAAKALGATPILALLGIEYALFPLRPICLPSESHPSTRLRLDAVWQYLSTTPGDRALLVGERAAYAAAWEMSTSSVSRETLQMWRQLEEHFLPVAARIASEVDALNLAEPVAERASLDRCARRLQNASPVSAQGATRQELRQKIEQYEAQDFGSDSERVEAFRDLTDQLTEHPLPVGTILLSCFERRISEFTRFSDEILPLAGGSTLQDASEAVIHDDDLIATSISTAAVHATLLTTP